MSIALRTTSAIAAYSGVLSREPARHFLCALHMLQQFAQHASSFVPAPIFHRLTPKSRCLCQKNKDRPPDRLDPCVAGCTTGSPRPRCPHLQDGFLASTTTGRFFVRPLELTQKRNERQHTAAGVPDNGPRLCKGLYLRRNVA